MKRLNLKLVLLMGVLAVLAGCATKSPLPKKDYTEFRKAHLSSILIVPVINRSVDVDAPDYFLSTIARPLAERGYYVYPINLVKRVMEDDGLADANMVHGSDPMRLASLFGADSVLYITIERWDSKYAVFATVTTVEMSYLLKSGATGQELWKHKEVLAYDPTAGQNGLIAKAVAAAIEKAKPNYIPLARQANGAAVIRNGQGLPAGPFHPLYNADSVEF